MLFTVAGMYHPWRAFRALHQFELVRAALPEGTLGETDFDRREVRLALGLNGAERRSTIAHEVEHILRGWSPCTGREECIVDQAAARKLIPIRALGEAMAWAHREHEVADELNVDVWTVRTRLRHLHPAETHYLRHRLRHRNPDDTDQESP